MRRGGALGLGLLALGGCAQLLGLDKPVPSDGVIDAPRDDSQHPRDSSTDVAITSSACPNGYDAVFSGGTYRMVNTMANWTAAMDDCTNDALPNSSKRTHLAVLTSDQELAAILGVTQSQIWIGLTDRKTEGVYRWVTNQQTSYPPTTGTPWAQGEPSSLSPDSDCVSLDMFSQFGVDSCATAYRYLCECDSFAPDTANY